MTKAQWQSYLRDQPEDRSGTASPPGITWLADLTAVAFEGPDALRFLQGYLTCDTARLGADRLTPAAFLNIKGRVIANGWCAATSSEEVIFICHASLVDPLAKLLGMYLRFSKTRLNDTRDNWLIFGGLGLPAQTDGLVLDATRQIFVCQDLATAVALWQTHPHLDRIAWDLSLVADRLPVLSAAVSDAFLPQMLDLARLGAVSFDKGCYLGQEIVARAQHRGQVKRHLLQLGWHGSVLPEAGAELADASGRTRAVVVQAAGRTPGGTLLAVVQDDAAPPLAPAAPGGVDYEILTTDTLAAD